MAARAWSATWCKGTRWTEPGAHARQRARAACAAFARLLRCSPRRSSFTQCALPENRGAGSILIPCRMRSFFRLRTRLNSMLLCIPLIVNRDRNRMLGRYGPETKKQAKRKGRLTKRKRFEDRKDGPKRIWSMETLCIPLRSKRVRGRRFSTLTSGAGEKDRRLQKYPERWTTEKERSMERWSRNRYFKSGTVRGVLARK